MELRTCLHCDGTFEVVTGRPGARPQLCSEYCRMRRRTIREAEKQRQRRQRHRELERWAASMPGNVGEAA